MNRVPSMPCLVAVSLALVASVAAPPAHGFDFMRHGNMTKQVMQRQGMPGPLVDIVTWGSMFPDVVQCARWRYCVLPYWPGADSTYADAFSAYHFDDDNINGALDLTYNEMIDAQNLGSQGPLHPLAVAQGYCLLGSVMHTAQDFYAHSSYLEINLPYVQSNGLSALPLWEGQPYVGVPWFIHNQYVSGVITGYFLKRRPAGGLTHDQLSKDNWYSPEGGRLTSLPFDPSPVTYYGDVSGSFSKSAWNGERYSDIGLAPRHTIRALDAFLGNDVLFRYYFAPQAKVRPALGPDALRRIAETWTWAATDSTIRAIGDAAAVLMARAVGDSSWLPDPAWFDAYGVPNPATVSVLDAPVSRGALITAAGPNPSNGVVEFSLRTPRAGRLRVSVYDSAGRLVRNVLDTEVGAGAVPARWAGEDDAGRPAGPGVYFVRASGFGLDEARRLVVTR